jgi:hypothetical protein
MAPEENLTRDGVWRMIKEAIEQNNVGIERRQHEILEELAEMKQAWNESSGVRKMVAWGIPVLVAILTLAAEIIRSSK